jgi:hypothetical protein
MSATARFRDLKDDVASGVIAQTFRPALEWLFLLATVLLTLVFTVISDKTEQSISRVLSALHNLPQTTEDQTLETRILALTESLNDAAQTISSIEQEISKRKALVEGLQRDADEAKRLSTLSSEQVSAVAQALRGELRSENRAGYWVSVSTNLMFAIIGALIGEGFRILRRWRLRRARSRKKDV